MYGSETIVLLSPHDERWMRFITEHPETTPFHHPAWMGLLAASYRYQPFIVAVTSSDGSLKAGLPMMEVHSALTGRRWVALPFTDHCRPLVTDPSALSRISNYLTDVIEQGRVPRIVVHAELLESSQIRVSAEHVLHTVALEEDPEAVAARVHRMHRRNIVTATKAKVRIEQGTELDHIAAFYQIHLETRRYHGTPIQPWHFFEGLVHLFAQGLGFVLLAYHEDRCIAGAVFLHFQRTLICKYAASRRDSLELRPNNLIFDFAIRWGCMHGCQVLDLGRTDIDNTGLRDFKTKWGAVETPLAYSKIPSTVSSLNDGWLNRHLQRVIRNSPPWMCRVVGEILYRHVA